LTDNKLEKVISPHQGHRMRMKLRFMNFGLESFDDHNVLELLLFFAVPRGDVNPIAHALMKRFGKLSNVFDAHIDELMKIDGIGENAATLIKLIPQISRRYLISRAVSSNDIYLRKSREAGQYLLPFFYGERDEVVYMVCLDCKCRVLDCREMFRGSVNAAGVSIRKIVENALNFNATNVILAHNHTSGVAIPSSEDKVTTRMVAEALSAVEIQLVDHIVVADDDFVSMSDSGFFKK
jgi:DNA repair protein RadC